MTAAEAKQRHAQLADEIRRHDHAYYVEGRQLITDREYDQLFENCRSWRKSFPNSSRRNRPPNASAARPARNLPASNISCRCCRSTRSRPPIIPPAPKNPIATSATARRTKTRSPSFAPSTPPSASNSAATASNTSWSRRWTACPSAFITATASWRSASRAATARKATTSPSISGPSARFRWN